MAPAQEWTSAPDAAANQLARERAELNKDDQRTEAYLRPDAYSYAGRPEMNRFHTGSH
ncbi:hypothetical protein GCM10010191_54770 [Actinomadura vinacea]|uniref:Uncharacterized protein n=1 Tax=Actinomadura vinacea TaxID=115336 RepID=A0ABN3JLJ6_9ACTN